jgi:TonB family protein
MKRLAILLSIAVITAPPVFAQCEPSGNLEPLPLSKEKLAIRDALYTELCRRGGGNLVDGDDAALQPRLQVPKRRGTQIFDADADTSRLIRLSKAPVVLAYIVEATGDVSWVSVLESSGDKTLDSLAFSVTKGASFGKGIQLDGRPIRMFRTIAMFKPQERR